MQSDRKKISTAEISGTFRTALDSGVFPNEDSRSGIFFSFDKIEDRMNDLREAFPTSTIHAVAVKTNPLVRILQHLHHLGAGLEAASFPEVQLAKHAGVPPNKIVFDSPAKTGQELVLALEWGIHINIDSFAEAGRIDTLISEMSTESTFGLRVNPQTGSGKIASMSTAGEYSKFGIPMDHYRKRIKELFEKYPWLTGLHVHSGSQGLEISQMGRGVEKVYSMAEEINKSQGPGRVRIFDIGGGFPISYHSEIPSPEITEYAEELQRRCANLFTNYQLITEFGRFVYGHAGWVASRVEYVKEQPDHTTAVIHVGADLFLRECYNPEDWHHDFAVLDQKGQLKETSDRQKYHIGGPLCFEGDMLARGISLPRLEEGDYLVIRDAGANTVNLWSRHCSRYIPKIIGYRKPDEFLTIKEQESFDDIMEFWS